MTKSVSNAELHAWEESFRQTWMGYPKPKHEPINPKCVDFVDNKLREFFRKRGTLPSLKVKDGAKCILMLGNDHQWYLCIAAMALVGELLICGKDGGILPPSRRWWNDADKRPFDMLVDFRNAACHPAQHDSTGSGSSHIKKLSDYFNGQPPDPYKSWSQWLEEDVSRFATKYVAKTCLNQLDAVGRHFCRSSGGAKLVERYK